MMDTFPIVKRLPSVAVCREAAAALAEMVEPGDLLLFTGEIGAGKTTFIQALARGLGVRELVTSPSFVLHALYESGRVPFSHVDLYRLDSEADVENIGFEDYYDSAVTAIEWADRYSRFDPPFVRLHFDYGQGPEERVLTITPAGRDWEARLAEIFGNRP